VTTPTRAQVAIISGGNSGIGYVAANELIAQDAKKTEISRI